MSISIVIPTWNEELWIPRLLECIRKQEFAGEIVVADNNSEDSTRLLAQQSGCIVTEGGHPGRARNIGAARATGSILLFVDADSIFGREVMEYVLLHMQNPEVVAVHFKLRPITKNLLFKFGYSALDLYIRVFDYFGVSQGLGSFIAVRRSAFDAVGGFDEQLQVGEDVDVFRRLCKLGRVHFERAACVYVSPRRLLLENPIWFSMKCLLWSVLRLVSSRLSIIQYRWDKYPEEFARQEVLAGDLLLQQIKPR